MSPPPVRVLSDAILLPSGENAGSRSLPGPWLTWTRCDPSGSAVTMRAFGATQANPPLAMGVATGDEHNERQGPGPRHGRILVDPARRATTPFGRTVTPATDYTGRHGNTSMV